MQELDQIDRGVEESGTDGGQEVPATPGTRPENAERQAEGALSRDEPGSSTTVSEPLTGAGESDSSAGISTESDPEPGAAAVSEPQQPTLDESSSSRTGDSEGRGLEAAPVPRQPELVEESGGNPPRDQGAPAENVSRNPWAPSGSQLQTVSADDLFSQAASPDQGSQIDQDTELKAVIEAIIYVTEEPLPKEQIAASLQQPPERVRRLLEELSAEYDRAGHGICIREVAGGYKMATKPEHHEAVRAFAKSLKPPLKLSLAALETLAVIAYKQPVTAPEVAEIRGVQGTGVLKTLLDRKLIATAGRKNVIGKPILYKTTKDFLVQFGLKDLGELPSLKEFEEIRRMALAEPEADAGDGPLAANAEHQESEDSGNPAPSPQAQEPAGPEPPPEPLPVPPEPPEEPAPPAPVIADSAGKEENG